MDGDHDNSLKLLNEAAASTYGINIFNILKGNLYVKEVVMLTFVHSYPFSCRSLIMLLQKSFFVTHIFL